MALTLLLKLCLGLVGVASVGSVISVPVILSTTGKSIGPSSIVNGGGRRLTLTSIDKCKELSGSSKVPVNFADDKVGSVCGTIDSESHQLIDSSGEFSSLFQGQWADKEQDWSSGIEGTNGMKQCIGEEKPVQGAILVEASGSGAQYLGQCGDSEVENTRFVKKESRSVENSNLLTLSICDKECGNISDSGLLGGSPKILQEEKRENGVEVKFYR